MQNIKLKIFSLLFGIGLWFYAISLQDFEISIEVPVVYTRMPEVLSIASKPPTTISVSVSGNLIDLIHLKAKKQANVSVMLDVSHVEQGWTHFTITKENFFAPEFPEISYVEGEHVRFIDVEFDTKIHRKIPVELQAEFEVASGFTFVDEPMLEPAEVTIFGARSSIANLQILKTKKEYFKNLKANSVFAIPLILDSLPNYIWIKDSLVQVSLQVQPLTEKTFKNIPVHLIGIYDKEKYTLTPNKATVKISGGSEVLKKIKSEDVDLFIEYNRFTIENTDNLSPNVKLVQNVNGYQIIPDKFYLKEIETNDSVLNKTDTIPKIQSEPKRKNAGKQ